MHVAAGLQITLVDLDAPARAVRSEFQVPVNRKVRIQCIGCVIAARGDAVAVVPGTRGQAVFENLEVRRLDREVDVYRGGERSHGIVRNNRHVVGLGQGRDPPHFQQPADGPDVGLNNVRTGYLQQPVELKPLVETFAGGKRNLQRRLQAAPGLDVFRPHRLFAEQRMERGQRIVVKQMTDANSLPTQNSQHALRKLHPLSLSFLSVYPIDTKSVSCMITTEQHSRES